MYIYYFKISLIGELERSENLILESNEEIPDTKKSEYQKQVIEYDISKKSYEEVKEQFPESDFTYTSLLQAFHEEQKQKTEESIGLKRNRKMNTSFKGKINPLLKMPV